MLQSFDENNDDDDQGELIVPENFAQVEGGVYRSSFPRTKDIPFLKKLKLKSVISLVPEDYPKPMVDFYTENNIQLLCHGLDGNKWPHKSVNSDELNRILFNILNPLNRPLLIHCNKGKHRTGTVIGCLRKIRQWSLSSIFQEYLQFAAPKTRLEDQYFIETFQYKSPISLEEYKKLLLESNQNNYVITRDSQISSNLNNKNDQILLFADQSIIYNNNSKDNDNNNNNKDNSSDNNNNNNENNLDIEQKFNNNSIPSSIASSNNSNQSFSSNSSKSIIIQSSSSNKSNLGNHSTLSSTSTNIKKEVKFKVDD